MEDEKNIVLDQPERWAVLQAWENYCVSESGLVKNILKNNILRPALNRKGYPHVILSKNGERKHFLVHRLVAILFVENPFKKPFVNHKDGNKKNSHYSNLEWVTQSENELHAHRSGLKVGSWKGKIGKDNPNSRPITQWTIDGEFVRRWENAEEAGRLGLEPSCIHKCCKKTSLTYKKHKWTYEK